jgi:hypothetical protein
MPVKITSVSILRSWAVREGCYQKIRSFILGDAAPGMQLTEAKLVRDIW